jgi:endonuclease YncB( thermonuclease family)
MRARPALAALTLAAVALLGPLRALEGDVVAVRDGDSFELLVGAKQKVEVRIAYIDSPERAQPWANQSRDALAERIRGRHVRVRPVDTDPHDRVVGEVFVGERCVGCELVRDGHAWVYRHYSKDPALLALEEEARSAERGLWSLPAAQRVPPWEWRHGNGRPKSACDPPPSCERIASCDEARKLLAQCGPVGLDGDGDGVPCERRCAD